MKHYVYIQEADLAAIQGGNALLESGEALAAEGKDNLINGGGFSIGPGGVSVSGGRVFVGILESIAAGWMMIGGLIWEGIEAVVDTP